MLILSTWTVNAANLYSASLSMTATFPAVPQWVFVCVGGAAGMMFALMGIIDSFVPFLLFLGIIIPPIAAIYVIDGFITFRDADSAASIADLPAIRWPAVGVWIGSILIALLAARLGLTLTDRAGARRDDPCGVGLPARAPANRPSARSAAPSDREAEEQDHGQTFHSCPPADDARRDGQAHEVYIERDGNGPARIYLAEPEHPLPAGGDPAFPSLKAPRLVPASAAAQVRKAGYIEVAVPEGDVRAWDDNVFAPWDEAGKKAGAIYYARAGRSRNARRDARRDRARDARRHALRADPRRPSAPGVGHQDRHARQMGAHHIHRRERRARRAPPRTGRYLLAATIKEEGERDLPGGKVSIVQHITTTTFVAQ